MYRKLGFVMVSTGVLCFITLVTVTKTELNTEETNLTSLEEYSQENLRNHIHVHNIAGFNKRQGCEHVCDDLPLDDTQPVCMMISRYKKGYQFFVNHCHARRTICKDNLILHMVHPSRCMRTNTFFMPVS